MNKVKISIICLAVLLILLVVACIVFYKSSGKSQESEAVDNSSVHATEDEPATDDADASDTTNANTVTSVLEEIHADTNDPLSTDEWSQVLAELNGSFTKDDFEYLGYLEDTDNLFFYKLKDSDIIVSVATTNGNAGIEHFDNSLSVEYPIIYFSKGMPENKEEIYKLDFDYNFYVTDYQGGDTIKYWSLSDPDNIMEMKIK